MTAFIQADKQHNKTERAFCWNAVPPNIQHSTTPANIVRKAQVIHVASFIICQLFCKAAQAVYSSTSLTFTHTQSTLVAICRNPLLALVAVGRFPSAGTSHRSPRRGALVQQGSPQLIARALLIRSSPLPYIILVYILGLCGSLHTNRCLNCT